MDKILKAIAWLKLTKVIQKNATKAMIETNGAERLGKAYLTEMKERITYYNLALNALKKEIPKKAIKIYGVSSQACPTCNTNVNWNYCNNCGQRIKY